MADYIPSPTVAKIAAILHATPLAEGTREGDILVIVFNELGKQLYTKDDIARLLTEAPIVNSEHPVQKVGAIMIARSSPIRPRECGRNQLHFPPHTKGENLMQKLKDLFKSRKFWAALVGLTLIIVKAVDNNFPIPEADLLNMVYLIVAYILGTSLEDFGRNSAR